MDNLIIFYIFIRLGKLYYFSDEHKCTPISFTKSLAKVGYSLVIT